MPTRRRCRQMATTFHSGPCCCYLQVDRNSPTRHARLAPSSHDYCCYCCRCCCCCCRYCCCRCCSAASRGSDSGRAAHETRSGRPPTRSWSMTLRRRCWRRCCGPASRHRCGRNSGMPTRQTTRKAQYIFIKTVCSIQRDREKERRWLYWLHFF